jgi:hypothetical protein
MRSENIETFLAKLYVDEDFKKTFLKLPHQTAVEFGLSENDVAGVLRIDRNGLVMAAHSFKKKREGYALRRRKTHPIKKWIKRFGL